MSSRDAVLGRIRVALRGDTPPALPPVSEVWPRQSPPVEEMARRFTEELTAVHGEVIRVGTMVEAQQKLAQLAAELNWDRIGRFDRPLCREATTALETRLVVTPPDNWGPKDMADLSAGVIEADCLLADTGSSLVICGTAQERLLCYLPPVCVVVATSDRLVEHLAAAWPSVADRAADPRTRGEYVIITGPSRTSDIEKILILGVHGPMRLLVLLVG